VTVRCAAAISRHPVSADAVGEVLGSVVERLGADVDVAMLCFTSDHVPFAGELARAVDDVLAPGALIGSSAGGVMACGEGVEGQPGLVLWAANGLPGARAQRLVGPERLAEAVVQDAAATLVLLADPFSFPVDAALRSWRHDLPALRVVGGLASASPVPGGNRLLCGPEVHRDGAVSVLLPPVPGPFVDPQLVVSQGCRPIGRPWVVTAAERNVLIELGGRPALERVAEMLEVLDEEDRRLAATGLHCGIVVDEHLVDFGRGDFLVRGVLAADRERRTVTIGDVVEVGATVQFQVRDATTASEDLEVLMAGAVAARQAAGGLIFTCNGRGAAMFGDAHHDARVVATSVGPASAGMFCAGEIGPVADRNELHGFTASVAVFHGSGTVGT
jgi:small ligand-binding sensory domain FIST